MDCRASLAKTGEETEAVGTVVLAASGMCAGGRVVNYLKALLGDTRNDVLFVGYQAAGTTGRDILRYGNKPDGYVEFEGQRYDIKAGIHALTGCSAHAGQRALDGLLAELVPGAKVWVP